MFQFRYFELKCCLPPASLWVDSFSFIYVYLVGRWEKRYNFNLAQEFEESRKWKVEKCFFLFVHRFGILDSCSFSRFDPRETDEEGNVEQPEHSMEYYKKVKKNNRAKRIKKNVKNSFIECIEWNSFQLLHCIICGLFFFSPHLLRFLSLLSSSFGIFSPINEIDRHTSELQVYEEIFVEIGKRV